MLIYQALKKNNKSSTSSQGSQKVLKYKLYIFLIIVTSLFAFTLWQSRWVSELFFGGAIKICELTKYNHVN